MSLRCMVWAFDRMSEGKVPGGPAVSLVFLKLADRANDDGVCWPGLDTLGRDVGLSRRTVERAIAYLVESGLVIKNTRRDKAGRDLSNVYHLNLNLADEGDGGGRQIDRGGRQIDGGGPQIDAQTSQEKLSTLTNHQRGARAGARAGGALRPNSRSRGGMVENEDGITFNPHDPRDASILEDISQHPRELVVRAIQAARQDDPLYRAFPSSVWRHLKKQKQVAGEEDTPPWARVVGNILISPQAEAPGKGGEE